MIGLAHRRCRAAIDQAFVGAISPRRWRRAREHMSGCAPCRTYHDRLAAASDALTRAAVNNLALDRIADQLLADHRPAPRRRWLVPGAAAVAAAAALLVVVSLTSRSNDAALQPRGDRPAALIPGERAPGVRVFCVSPDGDSGRVVGEARAEVPEIETPTMRCILGGDLQITYSTPSLEGMTMIAYSRDPSGQRHYYAPRTAEEPAVPLEADVVDEPLPWSTRLGVGHRPGDHELVVRFFDRPIAAPVASSELATPIYELRARFSVEETSL